MSDLTSTFVSQVNGPDSWRSTAINTRYRNFVNEMMVTRAPAHTQLTSTQTTRAHAIRSGAVGGGARGRSHGFRKPMRHVYEVQFKIVLFIITESSLRNDLTPPRHTFGPAIAKVVGIYKTDVAFVVPLRSFRTRAFPNDVICVIINSNCMQVRTYNIVYVKINRNKLSSEGGTADDQRVCRRKTMVT